MFAVGAVSQILSGGLAQAASPNGIADWILARIEDGALQVETTPVDRVGDTQWFAIKMAVRILALGVSGATWFFTRPGFDAWMGWTLFCIIAGLFGSIAAWLLAPVEGEAASLEYVVVFFLTAILAFAAFFTSILGAASAVNSVSDELKPGVAVLGRVTFMLAAVMLTFALLPVSPLS